MSEKIIRIKSGNEETTMNVTEDEYRNYFRPWWQMKKKEQRNREAMEQNGYTEESYEEWKENDMRTELFAESMEELTDTGFPQKQGYRETAPFFPGTWV